MPLLEIPGEAIFLHYLIPTSKTVPPSLDTSKPTLLLIHAHTHDSTLWEPQFQDQRLSGSYNLLAFDLPYHGKTVIPPKLMLDMWSTAALIGKGLDALQAGPVVIVASNNLSTTVALTFNILFPASVHGMALGNPVVMSDRGDELDENINAIDQRLLKATTVTELACPAAEAVMGINGPSLAPECIRPFINSWVQRYICWADNCSGAFSIWRFSAEVPPQELGNIRSPVTIILGSVKNFAPIQYQSNLDLVVSEIAQGGTRPAVHTIPGGEASNLAFTKPKEFNDILVEFLVGIRLKPAAPRPLDWKTAWSKFAAITGQPFRRFPAHPTTTAFSTLSKDLPKRAAEKFDRDVQIEGKAIELTGFSTYREDRVDRLHPELTEAVCMALWNSLLPRP